jgi:hypothetical protein
MALAFGSMWDPTAADNVWGCVALQIPAGALPQGNEFQCFASQEACEAEPPPGSMYLSGCSASGVNFDPALRGVAWDSTSRTPLQYRCRQDSGFCAGGQAGPAGFTWMCPTAYQLNAQPTQDGSMCFSDFNSCTMSGANSCLSDPLPLCQLLNATGGVCEGVTDFPYGCTMRTLSMYISSPPPPPSPPPPSPPPPPPPVRALRDTRDLALQSAASNACRCAASSTAVAAATQSAAASASACARCVHAAAQRR